MKKIKLTPITHKAKNRIREARTDVFCVVKEGILQGTIMVDIPEENDSMFIHADGDVNNVRWIKKLGDKDFKWEIIE